MKIYKKTSKTHISRRGTILDSGTFRDRFSLYILQNRYLTDSEFLDELRQKYIASGLSWVKESVFGGDLREKFEAVNGENVLLLFNFVVLVSTTTRCKH